MPVSLVQNGGSIGVACPTATVSLPAGTCISASEWERLGQPRGFEAVAIRGTIVLKKRSRRRRRRMFTQADKNDISWALQAAGSPKGPQVLQGIMHSAHKR